MRVLTCVMLVMLQCAVPAAFSIGDLVLARWTNHAYYPGRVDSYLEYQNHPNHIKVKFYDGDTIIHPVTDKSAILPDKAPDKVAVRDHVMATWKGGSKYLLGFIIEERESDPKYKVMFDDGDSDWYSIRYLRKFPVLGKGDVGARVWCYWGLSGLFYRGFITKVTRGYTEIEFDDGDTNRISPSTIHSMIAVDELPQAGRSYKGSKVIAYCPDKGRDRFLYGKVWEEKSGSYYVVSKCRNPQWEKDYQLRSL